MVVNIASIQHKERNYESAQYVLPSDGTEEERSTVIFYLLMQSTDSLNVRLNMQHRLIKQSFDGRLYIAPIELKDGDRVLESAVGTGIIYFHL